MSGPDLERFIEDFIEFKKASMGVDFIKEPITEDEDLTDLYMALIGGTAFDVGVALKLVIDRYWSKQAMEYEQKATFPEVRT